MATLLTEDFEGGSHGTTATSTNTSFSDASAGTPTFDSTQHIIGSFSCLFNPVASAENLQHSWVAGPTGGLDFYLLLPSLPTGAVFLANMQSATTVRASLRLNADGTLTIRNGLSAAGTSTAALSANTWYRLEWVLDNGAASQTLKIYPDHSLVPLAGGTVTGTYNQGTFNRLLLGVPAANTASLFIDKVKLVDTALFADLGPAATAATPQPDTVAAVAQLFTPTVSFSAVATPGRINLAVDIPLLTASASAVIGPDPVQGTATVPAAGPVFNVVVTPGLMHLVTTVSSPGFVTAERTATAAPDIVTAVASVPLVGITTGGGSGGTGTTRVYRGPVRTETWQISAQETLSVKVDVNQTLYRTAATGVWHVGENLTYVETEGADRLYYGGYQLTLTDDQLDELIAAGLGQYVVTI